MSDQYPVDDNGNNGDGGRKNGRLPHYDDREYDEPSSQTAEPETRLFGVQLIDEEMSIALIEDAHSLPGVYPVVVIAARDEAFREILIATVEIEQDGDPFTITDRESSRGNFVSYRVELHVESGRAALSRKAVLAALEGVVTVL